VPQATILVDGKPCGKGTCDVNLTGPNHELSTRLDGYKPAVTRIDTSSTGTIAPVLLTPEPRLTAVRVFSDLRGAAVAIDRGRSRPLEHGKAEFEEVPAGDHVLRFQAEDVKAEIPFAVIPAAIPTLRPLRAEGIAATATAVLGTSLDLVSTLSGAEVRIDGNPAGKLTLSGLTATVGEGSHELTVIGNDGLSSKLTVDAGPVPAVVMYLGGRTARESNPKQAAQVAATATPPARPVSRPVTLPAMATVPMTAALSVRGAPVGAQVLVDDRVAGTTSAGQTFSVPNIPLGRHTVTVRKEHFKTRATEVVFVAGGTQAVDGTLAEATGTLRIDVSPTGAAPTITIQREGEPSARSASGRTETLDEGSYTVTGHLPGRPDASAKVQVVAGTTVTASLAFRTAPAPTPAPAKDAPKILVSLADATRSLHWSRESGFAVRQGGGLLLIPKVTGPGSIVFIAEVQKGKRLEWVMNYENEKNQILYQIDGESLTRTVYQNGAKTATKAPLQLKREDWFKVGLKITDDAIEVYAAPAHAKYQPLDRVTGNRLAAGQFGFLVPAHDQIALSEFEFAAK
jgi:hypothetical protein